MPQCKHGKLCKVKNCPLKHEDEEERAECIFFRQGFCMHGPICKFRHLKRLPDECPAIATFDQYVASGNVPLSKKRKTHQPNQFYKITLCKHWLEHGSCPFGEECHYAHGEGDLKSVASDEGGGGGGGGHSAQDQAMKYEAYDPFRGKMDAPMTLPYNSNTKAAYFLFHSPDLPTLLRGYQGKYWGTSIRMAQEINDAFRTHEWVIVYFIVRGLRGIYGVASIESPIQAFPTAYSPLVIEFPVKWLRILRLSVRMVSHLKLISGSVTTIGRSQFDGKIDKNAG
jgi:cleavage and polyadenylation specificity factor subunit 4